MSGNTQEVLDLMVLDTERALADFLGDHNGDRKVAWFLSRLIDMKLAAALNELADAKAPRRENTDGEAAQPASSAQRPFGYVVQSRLGNLNFVADEQVAMSLREEGLSVTTVYA